MGLRELTEHLVLRALVGRLEDIEALKLYLLDGLSPSEVAARLPAFGRYGKTVVRGRIRRAVEAAGSLRLAAYALRTAYPRLLEVRSAVVKGSGYVCLLCGRRVERPLHHLRREHRDVVEGLVGELLEAVRGARGVG